MPDPGQSTVAPVYLSLEPYLTKIRLAPYVAAMGGDYKKAIQLYRWNIALSGAMHEALHVFEVVLRNAMDVQLCRWNASQVDPLTGSNHSADWLLDPSKLLSRLVPADDRSKARQRAGKSVPRTRAMLHADVLAQMPLQRMAISPTRPGRGQAADLDRRPSGRLPRPDDEPQRTPRRGRGHLRDTESRCASRTPFTNKLREGPTAKHAHGIESHRPSSRKLVLFNAESHNGIHPSTSTQQPLTESNN